jgi:hypothetical protein
MHRSWIVLEERSWSLHVVKGPILKDRKVDGKEEVKEIESEKRKG